MLRRWTLVFALMLAPVLPAGAQTLADMRAEVAALASQLQALKAELVAGGQPAIQAAGGASALERMDAIEAALARLTGQTEELSARVNKVVADGTNRIGDIEFRLTELEGGDPAALPPTTPLGSSGSATTAAPVAAPVVSTDPAAAPVTAPLTAPATAGASMATDEQASFDRAQAVLGQGDFRGAAALFATFAQSFPGGPLTAEAMFLEGESWRQAGDTKSAARAYLNAYSADPNGPRGGEALLRVGTSLRDLGQTKEACLTLAEAALAYAGSAAGTEADLTRKELSCP